MAKAKKQSSSKLSSLAARLLQPSYEPSYHKLLREARKLAASVLSQDETKGQKPKRK